MASNYPDWCQFSPPKKFGNYWQKFSWQSVIQKVPSLIGLKGKTLQHRKLFTCSGISVSGTTSNQFNIGRFWHTADTWLKLFISTRLSGILFYVITEYFQKPFIDTLVNRNVCCITNGTWKKINDSQFPSAMDWWKKVRAWSIKQIFLSDIRTT